MSHEQEPERDNNDTNPSWVRVLGMAVIGYVLVACVAWFFLFELGSMGEQLLNNLPGDAPAVNVVSPFPTAVYLAPADDVILTPAQRGYANLLVARDTTELATILGSHPEINLIYLHPGLIATADTAFLQQQYRNGKLIAALNTPLSVLAEKLGLTPNQPDIPLETFVTAVISLSAIKSLPSGGALQFTNTYGQFEQVPLVLDGLQ